ncbi:MULTISPECIES: lytic murein transglycosylase [Rhodomicrobium]|uniref:lytic murein transglycosylase n=1 Tax=Rhodomicrobium TaxID=1068 RepID=UPI000B4B8135|nr:MULTISPECIES: lytic murein transglycosylase [Rhodomicrobium]
MAEPIARRSFIAAAFGAVAAGALSGPLLAQTSSLKFPQWVEKFRARARARGISDAVYDRVMGDIRPDTSVYALDRAQPEFNEKPWQYLNRRVSDWRISTGKERAREYAPLLARIEKKYGVDRNIMLGLWGMESAFGEVVFNPKHMRPVIPALSALAWGDPRRRSYWEQELLNALTIIQRGWSTPKEMVGSWAGAMGHTQWMPEVWLNMGVDFNGDGRISPFGAPDDALAGTAQYLVKRGDYRPGEGWGYEVTLPDRVSPRTAGMRTIAAWRKLGVERANEKPFPRSGEKARLWQPMPKGPVLLVTQNFQAVKSYNPSNLYALAIVLLGDRIGGEGPLIGKFPGGERPLTLSEMQEVQRRLTAAGYDTGGADGRVGQDTMRAVAAFQAKVGIKPADGYAGLKVLAKLREGGV